MRRWVQSPLLSAALAVMWLALNRSVSMGHVLLAVLLGLVLPLLLSPLRPTPGPMRRPMVVLRLVLRVGADVVVSALQVGRGVLTAHRREPRARFVLIPLELRDLHGLAALAVITTVVPGTVWAELAPDRSALLLHVFDVDTDDAEFAAHFKARYERPLLEIFQ
ncbi:Na+/H+ antiporter subunit E [Aquincola sp. S2]|uniref:Na+/H+ antiporter subunit E n=1 Tax=Pseudaquabacterium terrae TaxID=2732868 RepID=A0ABX2ERB7_9BURK|nr:Na+/H+ antiporter subunit E [Aquabacterium terrae]NRF71267.1 Na+/H+ antiporter subunit E [Aquabacterium terrae]